MGATSSKRDQSHFNTTVPYEALCSVLYHVAAHDIASLVPMSHVCQRWSHACRNDELWQRLYVAHFGPSDDWDLYATKNWYEAYKERYRVCSNWRHGRCKTQSFTGHSSWVVAVAIQGSKILTGSHDKTAKVWDMDVTPPGCVQTLDAQMSRVTAVDFDAKHFVTGTHDGSMHIYSAQTYRHLRRIRAHTAQVHCLEIDHKFVVSACGQESAIKIWQVESGNLISTLTPPSGPGGGYSSGTCCLTCHHEYIITGGMDRTVGVWNRRTGSLQRLLEGHLDVVVCVRVSDGCHRRIASGDALGEVRIWILQTGECWRIIKAHEARVWTLDWKDDMLVTGSYDTTIKFWNVEVGKCIVTYAEVNDGHAMSVRQLRCTQDIMVSVSHDKQVKVWNFRVHKRTIHRRMASLLGIRQEEFDPHPYHPAPLLRREASRRNLYAMRHQRQPAHGPAGPASALLTSTTGVVTASVAAAAAVLGYRYGLPNKVTELVGKTISSGAPT